MGVWMMAMVIGGLAMPGVDGAESPGAALVFVSDHPVAAAVREHLSGGRLAEAEAALRSHAMSGSADARRLAEEGQEIIRRLRREYRLSAEEVLGKVKPSIPDVTLEDIIRWRDAGGLQHRLFDGKVCYFAREPSNLFRFSEEARRRRETHRTATSGDGEAKRARESRLLAHLAHVVEAAESKGRAEVLPLRHHVVYRVIVPAGRTGARRGSQLRCWLPFPQEYGRQSQVKLIRTAPAEHTVAPNVVDGERLGGSPQRTVYLEKVLRDPDEEVVFEAAFTFVSSAYYPCLSDGDAKPLPESRCRIYLRPRPPHIAFTPELMRVVDEIVGDERNPLARARRIYRFVAEDIKYCAEQEYSVIPSFSGKALATRRGDCGVQSMLFITMCRAAGIPARWQSGWETRPDAWNMHDWAEFYVEPWGWLPADVSYGYQDSDDPRVRDFYFGHQDAYRMIVNLDYGSPLHPMKRSLRSEPADLQRGEVELDGRNLYFDEWDWSFKVEVEPAGDAAGAKARGEEAGE